MRKRNGSQEQRVSSWQVIQVVIDRRFGSLFLLGFVCVCILLGWYPFVGAQSTPGQKSGTVTDEDPFRLPAHEREVNPLGDVQDDQPRTPPIREQDLPEEGPAAPTPSVETSPSQPPSQKQTPPSEARDEQEPVSPEEEPPAAETEKSPSLQEPRPAISEEQPSAEPSATEAGQEKATPLPTREMPPGHPPVGPTHSGNAPEDAAAATEEAKLLSNIRQVTFVGQRAGESYFSQDGSLLVFQSEREPGNPFYQIYLLDLQSGSLRRVSPGVGKTTCPWIHPNKKKVLFASTHPDSRAVEKQKAELAQRASGQERRYSWDFDEQYDLFEADLANGKSTNLSKARGYDAEASWSPDGSLVAFASNRHAYAAQLPAEEREVFTRDPSSQMDIYLMKSDGTQVRRLTTSPGYDGGPFFSADGQKICWRRFSIDGTTAEIFTMNVDGSEQTQITQLGAMSWGPYFHPSGDYLIFATNLEGMKNFELYLVDTAGASTPARVTFKDGFDGLPAFSPDGKQLAWSSSRSPQKRPQIFFAEWNDEEARRKLGLVPAVSPAAAEEPIVSSTELAKAFPPINARGLRIHLDTLASEKMEGRLTGTDGERRATEYVASIFQWLGLMPAGDSGTYFQNFQFTGGVSLGSNNQLQVRSEIGEQVWSVNADWRPLSSSKLGTFEPAEIVFAGYGIVAPAADGKDAYDSYAHLDVADKWVIVFRYVPEGVSPQIRQHLNRYASLRYKTMVARDKGARGILFVSGPQSQVKEQLIPLSFDASMAVSSIAAISVSDAVAERLLQSGGKTLADLQETLDSGVLSPGFVIEGVRLEASIDIVQEKRTGRNVLARLAAGQSPGKTAVVVGAHVDHLGRGEGTSSLAREGEKGQIHYGADDNASGVAGLLEIAQTLTEARGKGELRLQRDVLFAAWSGEELGLLGSNHFVRTVNGSSGTEATMLTPGITAYLNMDMIGRMKDALVLQGVGSSSVWVREIERLAAPLGLAVTLQQDSYLPTDATAFYLKGVPILSAFTGAHAEYHTPRDTTEKINGEGVAKIARFMAAVTQSLATRTDPPDYVAATKPPTTVGRVAIRAYLGTIPDYTPGDTVGVKIAGVVRGGPADQAGLLGGDTIIEIAGRKIENIYDYTYALDGLKVGTPVEMRVVRQGQPTILKVTPGSRE